MMTKDNRVVIDDYSDILRGLNVMKRQIDTTIDFLEHGCMENDPYLGYRYLSIHETLEIIDKARKFLEKNKT